MGMSSEDPFLYELAIRLSKEEQATADLRAQLEHVEAADYMEPQRSAPAPTVSHPPRRVEASTPLSLPSGISQRLNRRFLSIWQTTLLMVLVMVIGFGTSSFFVSRALHDTPSYQGKGDTITPLPGWRVQYQGKGYTITPLPGWRVQSDGSGGVTFSDPRFLANEYRSAAQLGVLVNGFSALLFEFGSSFRLRCQKTANIPATVTINGNIWQESQYHCSALQDGGIASQIRVFTITHDTHFVSMYYLASVDHLDDFSNGSFDTIAQSFTFS